MVGLMPDETCLGSLRRPGTFRGTRGAKNITVPESFFRSTDSRPSSVGTALAGLRFFTGGEEYELSTRRVVIIVVMRVVNVSSWWLSQAMTRPPQGRKLRHAILPHSSGPFHGRQARCAAATDDGRAKAAALHRHLATLDAVRRHYWEAKARESEGGARR